MSTSRLPQRQSRRVAAVALALAATACTDAQPPEGPAPTLDATGLFADAATGELAPGVLPFAPQYPLWTDGAGKRRWIRLPEGTAIDATDPDDWQFPVGTRLWKQFTFADATETRFMLRRADGSWLYATYVQGDGEDVARLAPPNGLRGFTPTRGGRRHDVPSVADCRACHENGRTPVLGFSALQLSPDRDPNAPHTTTPEPGSLDLPGAVARGLVTGLPEHLLTSPPRTAARTPDERAALGYLHGNCGNCHNAAGPLQRLGMRLDQPLATASPVPPALATTLGVAPSFRHAQASLRITAGAPEASLLWRRIAADDPLLQMPPFGRHLVDDAARDLIARWIRTDLAPTPSASLPSPNPNR